MNSESQPINLINTSNSDCNRGRTEVINSHIHNIPVVVADPIFNNNIKEDLLSDTDETIPKTVHSPTLLIKIQDREIKALLDSGSQFICISQELFHLLKDGDTNLPIFPVSNLTVRGALLVNPRT